MPYRVLVEGAGALAECGLGLRELVLGDPWATVFHLPGYQGSWWRWLGEGEPLVVLVKKSGQLAGAATFYLARGILRYMGGPDVTDYQWPLALPGEEQGVARALATFLRGGPWRAISLRHMDERWATLLAACLEEGGVKARLSTDVPSPRISLEGGYAAYLGRLSSKQRHEVRRKLRRAAERLPGLLVRLLPGSSALPFLPIFYRLHASSYGGKGGFLHAGRRLFLEALARALGPSFALGLLVRGVGEGDLLPPVDLGSDRGELGGPVLAACLVFFWRGSLLLYNSAFRSDLAQLSPGLVLVQSLIAWAAGEGYRTFDFLRGGEEYKLRLGAVPRALFRLDHWARGAR